MEKWVEKCMLNKAFLHFLPYLIIFQNLLHHRCAPLWKIIKYGKTIWQKMKKSLVQLAFNPFFGWFRVSSIHSAVTMECVIFTRFVCIFFWILQSTVWLGWENVKKKICEARIADREKGVSPQFLFVTHFWPNLGMNECLSGQCDYDQQFYYYIYTQFRFILKKMLGNRNNKTQFFF